MSEAVTVYRRVDTLLEDNRHLSVYKIEIPDLKVTAGKYSVDQTFLTGNIPWSWSVAKEVMITGKWNFTLKLVPQKGHSPVAHISAYAVIFNKVTLTNSLGGPFSPCNYYRKIDSVSIKISLLDLNHIIKSVFCCLKIELRSLDPAGEGAKIGFPKTLKSGLFSDMKIQVGEKSFPAHRMILSAQSPVFLAMFSQPMKESQEAKVEISDCSPEAMEVFLNYLYSGSLSENISADILSQILHLAHKYQIEELLKVCELRLIRKLNLNNALETLKLSDLYDLKFLKYEVVIFMKPKQHEILNSPAWKELGQSKPDLVIQVFTLWLTPVSS